MKIIGSEKGIHSPEFHKKKTREEKIKRAIKIIILIIILSIPVYFARSEKFLIKSVVVSGNNVTKSEDIQQIVSDNLSGSYFWLFPHENIVLYPKDKIVSDLLNKQPRLNSVVVTQTEGNTLEVAVTERAPMALYCKDYSTPVAPEECYFLDDTGYVFSKAPSFSGNVYLVYATSDVYEEPIGHSIIDKENFLKTAAFAKTLPPLGIYPRIFLLKNDEYRIILSNKAEIMWPRDKDLNEVRTNLASFLADKSIKSDPEFLNKILYIDMRFGNKIFYKFRGE